ncbi:hypothetical protein AWC22_16880 [Mycobacterium riyadhense]|uniref:Uncharacterized protein n=1 Tax=Mycobacterium riyadhense TaxID=486698 RepID=A0A1X2CZK9_9MYCO|nr:hypothetical protein AWC22_16880 [Mycobacterium riyadhense]
MEPLIVSSAVLEAASAAVESDNLSRMLLRCPRVYRFFARMPGGLESSIRQADDAVVRLGVGNIDVVTYEDLVRNP